MSPYTPERRTAVVLTGAGAHGAYHAGVLRALREAGVKIDIFAGHGVGAGTAALAAIDGGARLWDEGGLWRSAAPVRMYRWRRGVVAAAWIGLALVGVLLVPVAVLGLGALGVVAGFLLEVGGTGAGGPVVAAASSWIQGAFARPYLPTIVPRLVTLAVVALVVVAAVTVLRRRPVARRPAGRPWWRAAGAPLDASAAQRAFITAVWELIRGADPSDEPPRTLVSRRYVDVLAESHGQPGFGELLVAAADLDARGDVVGGLLEESFRQRFFGFRPGRERGAEVVDLADEGRDMVMDIVAAALTPAVACDPHDVTFPSTGFWRGETHRCCDRAGLVTRLIEEVGAAGATQLIVVSAVAVAPSPHRLGPERVDPHGRLNEWHAADEAASLRDALTLARARFDLVSIVSPPYNAVGPFDTAGSFDEASGRRQEVAELVSMGYDDAHRQFIDPVVGASGEAFRARARSGAGQEPSGSLASWER